LIDAKVYIEYKDIVAILKKRKYILLLIIAFVLVVSVLYRTQWLKPVYEARASAIIGNVLNQEETQFQIDDVTRIQDYMQTYVMILKTNTVAEKTIKVLDLNMSVGEFKSHIQGVPQPKTQFMEIKVKWDSPEKTLAVLNAVTEIFIEEALRIYPTYTIKILEKVGPYASEALSDKLYYIVSILVSILISFLVVLLIEFFDNTIKSEEDIEKYYNIPVIGTIPKYKRTESTIIDSIKNNKYNSLDAFRTIRTNLLYFSKKSGIKSVVITSARPQEGKTTVASMLAIVLAQGGKKTLLIDCDLRNPSIQDVFAINGAGLSSLLMEDKDWTDVIYESRVDNLYVLPAGFNTLNPVELISSDKMKGLISDMKEIFDFVILDTPPVGLFTEAQVLSQITDGYLIVISANESDRTMTSKAVKLLQYAEGKIIGALLNKVSDLKIYKKYNHYYVK
jgi:capsular exopolysaccharide synthesis family protein